MKNLFVVALVCLIFAPIVQADPVRPVSLQLNTPDPSWRNGMWVGRFDSKDLYCLSHTFNKKFLQINDETELHYFKGLQGGSSTDRFDNTRARVFVLHHSNVIGVKSGRAFFYEVKCEDDGGFRPGFHISDVATCTNLNPVADVYEQLVVDQKFVFRRLGQFDTTLCSKYP